MGKLIKLAGLWKNTSKTGNNYLSGKIESIGKILVMQNKYKKPGEKSPDYYIYKSGDDEQTTNAVAHNFIEINSVDIDNDELPF